MTTAAPPKPAPAAPPAAPSRGFGSLRVKVLGLTILPVLALGLVWVLSTVLLQAGENQRLLMRGAVQTASTFSKSVLDAMESSGSSFSEDELRLNVQDKLRDFFESGLLPLDAAAVVDDQGSIVAAYAKRFSAPDAPAAALENPVAAFKSGFPSEVAAIQAMAGSTLRYERPKNGEDNLTLGADDPLARESGHLVLAAYPLPGGAGATLFVLNGNEMHERANRAVLLTIGVIAVTLVLVAIVATAFATGLSRRVIGLVKATDAISMGALDLDITAKGNDEITDLAEAIDRLRTSVKVLMARAQRR